jgi:uncharacterized protein with GYD domain
VPAFLSALRAQRKARHAHVEKSLAGRVKANKQIAPRVVSHPSFARTSVQAHRTSRVVRAILPAIFKRERIAMPKFLIRSGYTAEGLQGLIKDKPARRLAAVKKAVSSLGGKLENFYWALGDDDVVLIVDMPDAESVAALTMTVAASGTARSSTTRLLTDKEVDAAIGKSVAYRPPGKGK